MNSVKGSLDMLLADNKKHCEHYRKHSQLMQLIQSSAMSDKKNRARLLDCIQVFSDYFQKTVMLRSIFCDNSQFMPVALHHLKEEFGHNTDLQRDRHYRNAVWDPILEATSAWFAWKMLAMDNDEKTLIVHLVLESSANIFFIAADKVMQSYGETDYFHIHADLDEGHEQMGVELLQGLTPERYLRLQDVQRKAWEMLDTACDRIAGLTLPTEAALT